MRNITLRITLLAVLCLFASLNSNAQNIGPDSKVLVTFKDGSPAPFAGDSLDTTKEHAGKGRIALRIKKGYAVWDTVQDWSGFDFFKTEVFNAASTPVTLYVEIQDTGTTDYWTRVNYTTVILPGASTLVLPTALYVGEKSRPGRALDKAHIKRIVLNIEGATAPLTFDAMRLEKDASNRVHVPGLRAFSFGPGTSAPLSGFSSVTATTLYSAGRSFGFTDSLLRRPYDVLQPDPLYQKGIFLEGSTFCVDLPNGKYHGYVNIDYPSGFWGEYQIFHKRSIIANGEVVATDTLDLASFQRRYFRFANTEDRLQENVFDKYQSAYFHEKEFTVNVTDGKLSIRFDGDAPFAIAISALVIYPESEAGQGKVYLANLRERRRFYFDNYFKRISPIGNRDHRGAIPPFTATAAELTKGYAIFARDWMEDVSVNAIPRREEITQEIKLFSSVGQQEPIVFSLYPLRALGKATISFSDLKSGSNVIPATAIRAGVVSHRITRVTGEGSIYTISPRYIMPRSSAEIQTGTTTTFWCTLVTPSGAASGDYSGTIILKFENGKSELLKVRVHVYGVKLDEIDVAAGPWGSSLGLPWFAEELGDYGREMFRKSLAKIREYGCTTFSGIPTIRISAWKDRRPVIDYQKADQEMADARAAGFSKIVVNYNGGIGGFNNYAIDEAAMRAAGFSDYVAFLRAVLTEVDVHAHTAAWLPVAYNLCDEPLGDAAKSSAANARAWAEAAPNGLITTGATSVEGSRADDPHMLLAQALRVPNLNGHDEASVRAIQAKGGEWAFYNGGNRWTFGTYMYKCAKEYGMKFRLSWHWNVAAGDPYYALDCREDDYSWCATNAEKELIPTIHFDRDIRAGIDDYRYMLTLDRLIRQKPNHMKAVASKALLQTKLATFKLGNREHDAIWPLEEYRAFRLQLAEAIQQMSN